MSLYIVPLFIIGLSFIALIYNYRKAGLTWKDHFWVLVLGMVPILNLVAITAAFCIALDMHVRTKTKDYD